MKSECNYCRTLHGVAVAINSTLKPDEVLLTMVENVTKVLHAKGCSLLELAPDKKHLTHTATYGLTEDYIRKGPLASDRSIAEALKGNAVAIYDATNDDRVQYLEEKQQEGIASILCVPMILRDQIIGVARVYTSEPRRFTDDDIYFVEAIANLGAIAFENAKLYEAVNKDKEAFCQEMLEWRMARWRPWMAL